MQVFYYYLRDENRAPLVTVCLIKEQINFNTPAVYHRGYAICSPKDNPCKKTGRDLARYKALRARKKGYHGCFIKRPEATQVLRKIGFAGIIGQPKSQHNVIPHKGIEAKLVLKGYKNLS